MKQIYLIIAAIVIGVATSCDTEIEYRGEQTQPMIFVHASISPTDDTAHIFVGQTSFFLDNIIRDCADSAIVVITHNGVSTSLQYGTSPTSANIYGDNHVYDFYNSTYEENYYAPSSAHAPHPTTEPTNPDGYYDSPRHEGSYRWPVPPTLKAGDTIHLEAKLGSFAPVSSSIVIPPTIKLSVIDSTTTETPATKRFTLRLDAAEQNIDLTHWAFTFSAEQLIEYTDTITDTWNDPNAEPQIIRDTMKGWSFYSNDPIFFQNPDPIFGSYDITYINSPTSFLGKKVPSLPYHFVIEIGNRKPYHSTERIIGYQMVLNTWTFSQYLYATTLLSSYDYESNPFAEPVQIYTNIDGGAGYFSAITTDTLNHNYSIEN